MKKTTFPIGAINFKRGGKPMIDFKKTFNVCLNFIFNHNEMRSRMIEDLEKRGIDLKQKRKELKFQEYEYSQVLGETFSPSRWYKKYEDFLESEGILPKLNGAIETTIEKLISFFMAEYRKGKVKLNNQLRFTYSYFQQSYNELHRTNSHRVCINTLKNHFRKIEQAMASIFENKYRGQLCLPDLNTNCIVLTFAPNIIQFKDDRHTELLSASEPRLPKSSSPKVERFMDSISEDIKTLSTEYNPNLERSGGLTSLADTMLAFFR